MIPSESPIAAVERVLRHFKIEPTNLMSMMLIDAVRDTTPPPREMTIALLQKLLQSLAPEIALDDWAYRTAREIVSVMTTHPAVRSSAKLIGDERLWCTLEATIEASLLRVCRGLDLKEPAGDACRNFDAWGCTFDQDGRRVDPRSCRVCGGTEAQHTSRVSVAPPTSDPRDWPPGGCQ